MTHPGYQNLVELVRQHPNSGLRPGQFPVSNRREDPAPSFLRCCCSSIFRFQRNLDHPVHDGVYLEIVFWAARVCIMATDAGLSDGAVGVGGLKIDLLVNLNGGCSCPFRMLLDGFQLLTFDFAHRSILKRERPQANQSKADSGAGHRGQVVCFAKKLGR